MLRQCHRYVENDSDVDQTTRMHRLIIAHVLINFVLIRVGTRADPGFLERGYICTVYKGVGFAR